MCRPRVGGCPSRVINRTEREPPIRMVGGFALPNRAAKRTATCARCLDVA